MLSPDSRTVAFDLLRPPGGYDLDFALLTTYTLNLETMLALPLSLVARADNSLEELLADPLLLLEALRRAGERVHVFVDRAGIAIPRQRRELYALLEPSLHPVRAPGGGAFHPKVWVLRFMSEDGKPLIRVAILSRNLTFDRSWDIALASEAAPRQRTAGSRPLAEFVRRLPELCAESPAPSLSDRMEALADEVSRTRFPAPEGFSDDPVRFHVLGMDGRHARGRLWQPMSDGYDVLAVAPFVGSTALNEVARMGRGKRTLVSSRDQLDKLSDDALANWTRVCVLSDAAHDEDAGMLSGLHAKFLAVEHGWDVSWFVGSANLTHSAFTGRNVEVMAALGARKGRRDGKSGYGIERFLESGFEKLCEPYRRGESEAVLPETEEALGRLETVRGVLLDADLRVVCSPSGETWAWNLEGDASLPNTDVEVRAWPISIAEDQARPLELPLTWTLPIQRLTTLVAFRLHVPVEGVEDIAFTLSLPAQGMPEDRMHHVLRSLIGDPQRFMAFLRALLGGLDGMVDWTGRGDANGDAGPWVSGPDDESLLEELVRAASRDPDRLEPVRRLIEDFRKTEEGRSIVPDDFLEVWNAVNEALPRNGRS
ncbi:MAG: phospholipase D family protein [Alphaproteobacteria bacterium]|nr:phospholipase D family protein [Alphaproteobacteria bacterium]